MCQYSVVKTPIERVRGRDVGKQIPSEQIPSGTGEPLKETKDMLEEENNKQVCASK